MSRASDLRKALYADRNAAILAAQGQADEDKPEPAKPPATKTARKATKRARK